MTRKRLLNGLNRGPWRPEEDLLLKNYIEANGVGRWSTLPQKAGLMRSGKSCRLRWMNYLRPNVKRGHISADEEDLIIRLHKLLGNRWSLIAARVPGRTDNDVKNYWNIHLSKKLAGKGKDLNASNSQEKESSNKKIQSFGEQYNKGAGDSIEDKAASQSSALKSLHLDKLNVSTDSIAVPAEFKQEYTSTNSNVHRMSKIRSEKHELHIPQSKNSNASPLATMFQQNSVGILSDIIESSPDTDTEALWFDSLPWLDSYKGDKLFCNYDVDSTTVSPDVHPNNNLVSEF